MKFNSKTLSILMVLGGALSTGTLQAARVVNKTIATVNGESVLLSEFNKNWKAFLEQQGEALSPDQKKEAKEKLLQQLIDDRILLREAKKQSLRVNRRDLENGIVQVKSRFLPENGRRSFERIIQGKLADLTPEEKMDPLGGVDFTAVWNELTKNNPDDVKEAQSKFKEELVQEGLSEKQFKERIEDQLRVVELTRQEVRRLSTSPEPEEVKELFNKISNLINGQKPKGLEAEEQADIESLGQFFKAQTGEKIRARHILIRTAPEASFQEASKARRRIDDIRKKITDGLGFAEAAQRYSEDKASAVQGGDLGLFSKGQMVPAFEKSAFSLDVGKISGVVKTEFGYHLIKVEEKRAGTTLRFEDVEGDLREYLQRANAQKVFEKYIEDMRKSSAVKVLINLEDLPKND